MKTKRLMLNLDENKQNALTYIMNEDMETNMTGYIGRLIVKEYKNKKSKRSVGRPKNEAITNNGEKNDDNKNLKYPAPYDGGMPYTEPELESYYAFHNEEMPVLPKPLTKEEMKKWNDA